MVLGIEPALAEVVGVALGVVVALYVGHKGGQRQVAGHHCVLRGLLAVTVGKAPAAEFHALCHVHVVGTEGHLSDGGVFLHCLGAYGLFTVHIRHGEVGLPHAVHNIGRCLAVVFHRDGHYSGGGVCLGGGIGHRAHLAGLGRDVGQRVALAYHLGGLRDLNRGFHVAVGVLLEHVGCLVGLAVGTETGQRGGLTQVYLAVDLQVHHVGVLRLVEVVELQLGVLAVDVEGVGLAARGGDALVEYGHPVLVAVTLHGNHPTAVAAGGALRERYLRNRGQRARDGVGLLIGKLTGILGRNHVAGVVGKLGIRAGGVGTYTGQRKREGLVAVVGRHRHFLTLGFLAVYRGPVGEVGLIEGFLLQGRHEGHLHTVQIALLDAFHLYIALLHLGSGGLVGGHIAGGFLTAHHQAAGTVTGIAGHLYDVLGRFHRYLKNGVGVELGIAGAALQLAVGGIHKHAHTGHRRFYRARGALNVHVGQRSGIGVLEVPHRGQVFLQHGLGLVLRHGHTLDVAVVVRRGYQHITGFHFGCGGLVAAVGLAVKVLAAHREV